MKEYDTETSRLLKLWKIELAEKEEELERYIEKQNCELDLLHAAIINLERVEKLGIT